MYLGAMTANATASLRATKREMLSREEQAGKNVLLTKSSGYKQWVHDYYRNNVEQTMNLMNKWSRYKTAF